MSAPSSREFNDIANILRDAMGLLDTGQMESEEMKAGYTVGVSTVARGLAQYFAQRNGRFDMVKFLRASEIL